MIRDKLERIKERAYALWERAGGNHGEDEHHWHQASTEIDAEDKAPKRGRKPKTTGSVSAKKPVTKQPASKPAAKAAPDAKAATKATRPKAPEVPVVRSSGTQSVKAKATKGAAAAPAPVAKRTTPVVPATAPAPEESARKAKPGRKSASKG